MNISDKIFVAGHRGMVGSSIVRLLKILGYTNILTSSKSELDLTNQQSVNNWFEINKVIEVLNNKNVLNDLHKSHLNWWNIALSESAMSEFIIKEIKKLS